MTEKQASVAETLARRGRVGAAAYAVLAMFVVLATSIGKKPFVIPSVLGLFAIGAVRLVIALLYLRGRLARPDFRRWWRIGACISSVYWGIGAALVVSRGLDTDALIVLLATAGIAAGSVSSLSPDLPLLRLFLVTMLVPVAVATARIGTHEAYGAAAVMLTFFSFLQVQAGDLHRHFVEMLDSRELLQARARVIEEERLRADSANRAKSEFLANMSHELRTPLTAVIGYGELLIGDVTAGERIEYAEIVRRSGAHLLGLLNDILDLSKIEAGRMTVERARCSVIEALTDVESTLRVRAQTKGIELEVALEGEVPRTIEADPTRLRQILLNLAGNAIKFTETGRVRVVVGLRGDDQLVIAVEDTGEGIAAEDLARLFTPFTQVDGASNRKHQGTGLGLHISRELARVMGGDVEAVSEVGVGSVFTLVLPVSAQDREDMSDSLRAIRPTKAAREIASHALAGVRVLLAEDGLDNQRLISMVLRRAGAEVDVASDGAAAVRMIVDAPLAWSVVLMDMEMPELDGYGATARLRSLGHRGPIIALTAHALAGHRERCLAAGCDDHLTKPIDQPAVVETVARWAATRPALSMAPLLSTLPAEAELEELVLAFRQSLALRAEALTSALRNEDHKALEKLAHDLAGSGGSYGFAPITASARQLEDALRRGEGYDHATVGLIKICQRGAKVPAPVQAR